MGKGVVICGWIIGLAVGRSDVATLIFRMRRLCKLKIKRFNEASGRLNRYLKQYHKVLFKCSRYSPRGPSLLPEAV
jgi:hypothetical protein